MSKNIGLVDKIVRTLLALVVAGLFVTKQINGTTAIVLGAAAVVLLLTSLISFCPLYWPLHLSTRKAK